MSAVTNAKSTASSTHAAARRQAGSARPARRSQSERVAESDRKVLGAALRLIGERGYRATSLAAIGEEAGYSRGLVHERFGSKAGLLWALVKQLLRVWNQEGRAQGLTGHSGVDALCDILDNHRRAIEEDRGIRAFYALLFESIGPTPELVTEFRELHARFRAEIEAVLHAGMEAGTIRKDVDAAAQAALMMGTIRGIAFQWLLDPKAFSLAGAYEEQKKNLRRILAA
ncbi:MAG TPA: TetR/AcrR family transcriptional regulator [Polyangiaceae bacterium]|jgi:AcrR family transcriptional regulator|nr:TetR/AcrR family transcriptional regulator [Polyangiaceae bacterium]